MTVYRHISGEKTHGAPISLMCELLGVCRAGYYEWASRAPSDRALSDAWLIEKVRAIHAANREVYGVPGSTPGCACSSGLDDKTPGATGPSRTDRGENR